MFRTLLTLSLVILAGRPAAADGDLAARVKEVFRTRCIECHAGTEASAGVEILDHAGLLAKKRIVPEKPDESQILRLITAEDDSMMPPEYAPRMSADEVALVREWIAAGAPDFPADVARPEEDADDALEGIVGVGYVLDRILTHVRSLPRRDRPFVRYFSTNHLLVQGATREELDTQRDALAKAINHLSRESELVRLEAIDGEGDSVFAVDIRRLGWHAEPYDRIEKGQVPQPADLDLFDLVLLEYPYAVAYEDSESYDLLRTEFMEFSGMVRPIPYLRSDWFASVATQSPLYEDLLRLPFTLQELEKQLDVDSERNLEDFTAWRAGMTVSGVSRNNRVVERHPFRHGAYWKSHDFGSSRGRQNMFLDPVNLVPDGGEMIFNLPNGLQAYYVCDATGRRIEEAPTSIVTDKFAEDKTVRNGLACMRCHDQGMKGFVDSVRPAVEGLPGSPGFSKRDVLDLYPPREEADRDVDRDGKRFLHAMEELLGRPQDREPLIPVSRRFLEAPIQLTGAASELGLENADGLKHVFRSPSFTSLGLVPLTAGGVVRRDMFEDYFDDLVRQLGLGVPVVPLDALKVPDYAVNPVPFEVTLGTNQPHNVFSPGDEMTITVANPTKHDLHVELIGTSAKGRKVILLPGGTIVPAGGSVRFPETGSIRIQGTVGRESITLYASDRAFPAGVLLRGNGVSDRVVHDFGFGGGNRFDATRLVKRTINIETR